MSPPKSPLGPLSEMSSAAQRPGDGPQKLSTSMIESFSVLGVSNWGAYALACALYILNSSEVHRCYLRKATGPSGAPGEQNWAEALPSVAKVTHPGWHPLQERRACSRLSAQDPCHCCLSTARGRACLRGGAKFATTKCGSLACGLF